MNRILDLDHKLTGKIYNLSSNLRFKKLIINATVLLGSIPAFFILIFQLGFLKALILCIVSYCFNYALNEFVVKRIFKRKRPAFTKKTSYSFPSTHSSNLMCLLIISISMSKLSFGGVFISGILFVCFLLSSFSRIFVGEHYVIDVLAGWSIGVAYAVLVFQIFTFVLSALNIA